MIVLGIPIDVLAALAALQCGQMEGQVLGAESLELGESGGVSASNGHARLWRCQWLF